MNELIRIEEHNGKRAVSARELHTFLESERNFTDWIKYRIQQYGFTESVDYVILSQICDKPLGGRPSVDYALSLDMAKELSMVEGNEKGKIARQYFIACEKKSKSAVSIDDVIANPENAIRLLSALQIERAEKERLLLTAKEQERQLKDAAPKVQYFEDTLSSKSKLTVNTIAHCLGISHIKLNKLLCEWGVQYRQGEVYYLHAKYRNLGVAKHHPFPYLDSAGVQQTRQHLYWNEAGKKFILEMYASHAKNNCVTLKTA